MNVTIQGHDIEVELSGSYAEKGRFQPRQYPDIEIVDDLPEGVHAEDVRDEVRECIRSEEQKSRAQRKAEHEASKL